MRPSERPCPSSKNRRVCCSTPRLAGLVYRIEVRRVGSKAPALAATPTAAKLL